MTVAMVIVRFRGTSCLRFAWWPWETFHMLIFYMIYIVDFIPVPVNSTASVFITQSTDGENNITAKCYSMFTIQKGFSF